MNDTHHHASHVIIRLLLACLPLFYLGHAVANECLNLFPYDVKTDGLPKICQSDISGKTRNYSCQDYRSGNSRYRVLYHGGDSPKAVLALHDDGSQTLMSSHTTQPMHCPLKPPTGIPRYAKHRGLGVCSDTHERAVACSFFVYDAARQTQTHSYMVYYPRNPQEALRVEEEVTGHNRNAMVAELAFQFGMRLMQTSCCHDQALRYLAYAHHLFPRSEVYRHAYQRGRARLAMHDL